MGKEKISDLQFKKGGQGKDVLRRFLKNKPAVAGTVILLLLLTAFIVSAILMVVSRLFRKLVCRLWVE